jgi:hypothetical protein
VISCGGTRGDDIFNHRSLNGLISRHAPIENFTFLRFLLFVIVNINNQHENVAVGSKVDKP